MSAADTRGATAIDVLTEAAIGLIDENGIDAVTLRALAERCHYAPSSVSYHIGSSTAFRDHLWNTVSVDLHAHALIGDGLAPRERVELAVQWFDQHPHRRDFLLTHRSNHDQPPGPTVLAAIDSYWPGVANLPHDVLWGTLDFLAGAVAGHLRLARHVESIDTADMLFEALEYVARVVGRVVVADPWRG